LVKSRQAYIYQTFQRCNSRYWKINRVRRKWSIYEFHEFNIWYSTVFLSF